MGGTLAASAFFAKAFGGEGAALVNEALRRSEEMKNAGGSQPLWSKDGTWLLYTPAAGPTDPRNRRTAVPTKPGRFTDIGPP